MIGPKMAEVAALLGDPTRAKMLEALMDGRALTAGELCFAAGVTPQTASGHLARLTEARLLGMVKQGRHRYFRLASPLVGRMLETVAAFAEIEAPPRYRPRSPKDEALRLARTCYDHLAGRLAVALTDALVERGHLVLGEDGGQLTEGGAHFLAEDLGIDVAQAPGRRRPFCRPCLDWTERRPHLAGSLGAALARHAFAAGWVERLRDSRAIRITGAGATALRASFGIGPLA